MGCLRVLVVDDNPLLLRSIKRLLTALSDVEVVGEACSGLAALELAAALRPDVVLMDLAMPEMDGLEATRRLAALPQPPRVVIMTMHDSSVYRVAALAAGAFEFLFKADLVKTLRPLFLRLKSDPPDETA